MSRAGCDTTCVAPRQQQPKLESVADWHCGVKGVAGLQIGRPRGQPPLDGAATAAVPSPTKSASPTRSPEGPPTCGGESPRLNNPHGAPY